MTYSKNCLLIGMLGLFLQAPVQAISWQGPKRALAAASSLILRIIKPLGTCIQKSAAYVKGNSGKVAAITAIGAATTAAGYGVWRLTKPCYGLAATDPQAFCGWSNTHLDRLDSIRPLLARFKRVPGVKGLIVLARMRVDAIREHLFGLQPRNGDDRFEKLKDSYLGTADQAPLLAEQVLGQPLANDVQTLPHNEQALIKKICGACAFLNVPEDTSHEQFLRALNLQNEIAKRQNNPLGFMTPLKSTLRQLSYISKTNVAWANYCAFRRGRAAVDGLPRADQTFLDALTLKAMQIKSEL